MREKNILVTILLFVLLLAGCGGSDRNEGKNSVGDNLVLTKTTFVPVVSMSKEELQEYFNQVAKLSNTQPAQAILGIKAYKINYITHDDKNNKVIASGLITIPDISADFMAYFKQTNGYDFTLSMVSDQHGTIFTNKEAPTRSFGILPALYSGAALFMTLQPDYIGYGDSNQTHPYMLERSLANATVDMIKASIAFANKAGLPINGQVFLSGYSEGGFATMAAARDIQLNHPDINLKAVAAMAGPYDMETMGIATLSAPSMVFPPFLAYVAYAYSDVYDINVSTMVNEPYASRLPSLFDKNHSALEILASLPLPGSSPKDLFVPSFVDDFLANKDNILREKFRENSLLDWVPKMPMKIIQCTNDEIVPYSISSKKAYDTFIEYGSTSVSLVPIDSVSADYTKGETVHAKCAGAAYGIVIPWFASVRKGE